MQSAASSTKPPDNGLASSGGAASRGRLEFGKVYDGVISSASPSGNSYVVTLEDPIGFVVTNARWGSAIIAGLLGYRMQFRIPVGTGVQLVAGSPCTILSCKGTGVAGKVSPRSATFVEGSDLKQTMDKHKDSESWATSDLPNDMLEGELDITNLLGCGIQFLTNLTKMQAGERAKIECHAIGDLVRVISQQYHHMSSFGDMRIFEDAGRINVTFDGTSYEHEAWGATSESSPKAKVSKDRITPASVAEEGRWRFREYTGFVGDFVQKFITEPEEMLGNLAQQSVGKSRHYKGSDGSLLWQSVSEIALERVCAIPVPVHLKRPEDKDGNRAADYKSLDTRFLKLWDFGKNFEDISKTCFQLREYARWLSDFHGYARFHQLDKDWKVPTGQSTTLAEIMDRTTRNAMSSSRLAGTPPEAIASFKAWPK